MSIFDFAMKMEQDGRAFYLEHAEKVESPHLRKILLSLADDEAKHYRIFEAMRDGRAADFAETDSTRIFQTVKNVFEELKASAPDYSFPDDSQKIWEEAREVERKTEAFYREKAEEVSDSQQHTILIRIAEEEHRHWQTMEHVISFLSSPKSWLENAEWSNLDDY